MSYFSKCLGKLDLTQKYTGTQILRLVRNFTFGIAAFAFIVWIGLMGLKIYGINAYGQNEYRNWIFINLTGVSVCTMLIISFSLHKCITRFEKKYFIMYYATAILDMPKTALTEYILVLYDPEDMSNPVRYNIMPPLSAVLIHIVSIYMMFMVYKCYRNIQTPLLQNALESCVKFKNSFADEIMEIEFKEKDVFRKYFINPLDLIVDYSNILGSGQFGVVYGGRLSIRKKKTKLDVAVKLILGDDLSPDDNIDGNNGMVIANEIRNHIRVGDHTNISKLMGITTHEYNYKVHLVIISEKCSNGSLKDFLCKNRDILLAELNSVQNNVNLNISKRTDFKKFSTQIASALEHLSEKRLIHGDLALRNVLLDWNMNVKITDFGLSRRLYETQIYTRLLSGEDVQLPWPWMALEVLSDLKFSISSDVWSFGVTLWELYSIGMNPYQGKSWSTAFKDELNDGMRLEKPIHASQITYDLMLECWESDPANRPSFKEIKERLSQIQ